MTGEEKDLLRLKIRIALNKCREKRVKGQAGLQPRVRHNVGLYKSPCTHEKAKRKVQNVLSKSPRRQQCVIKKVAEELGLAVHYNTRGSTDHAVKAHRNTVLSDDVKKW